MKRRIVKVESTRANGSTEVQFFVQKRWFGFWWMYETNGYEVLEFSCRAAADQYVGHQVVKTKVAVVDRAQIQREGEGL